MNNAKDFPLLADLAEVLFTSIILFVFRDT
jgi:hypothetical protein